MATEKPPDPKIAIEDNLKTTSYAEAAKHASKNNINNNKEYNAAEEMENRSQKTFVFYDLSTAQDITELVIRTLSEHFQKPPGDLIHRISRNTRYRSRYEVTFKDLSDYYHLVEHGITMNGKHIRGYYSKPSTSLPKKPLIKFYAPNLPTWMDKRDLIHLFKDENLKVCFEKRDKRFGIPTGFWNLGFLDKKDEDFTLTYKGEDYLFLSVNKISSNKTRGKAEPSAEKTSQNATAAPPPTSKDTPATPTPKQNEPQNATTKENKFTATAGFTLGIPKPTPQQATTPTETIFPKSAFQPIHFNIEKPKYKIIRTPDQQSKQEDKDEEGQPYPKNSPNLFMSQAHKIQLKQLEKKHGKLSAKQLERQQELLNMEAVQPSLSTTDDDSDGLVVDVSEEDTQQQKRPLVKSRNASPQAKRRHKKK